MTKREEAIEAMARAIAKTSGWPSDMWDNPSAYSTSENAKEAYVAFATAAFDAAVKVLSEPSEGMIDAFADECADSAAFDPPDAARTFQAMLKAAAL